MGIDIPQDVIESIKDTCALKTREISIEFCYDIIKQIYDYTDGFYIMTPMKKVLLVCELIERCFDD